MSKLTANIKNLSPCAIVEGIKEKKQLEAKAKLAAEIRQAEITKSQEPHLYLFNY